MTKRQEYDVIVAGGGTAGCAAAYTAGKLGLKVLLIEKRIHLGGSITSGLVVPAMNAGGNQINTDFFNDLIAELRAVGGQVTYQGNQGWFNPELTKIALDRMMKRVNVRVVFEAEILSVSNEQIQIMHYALSVSIAARYIIDTTGDCEIGKLCGCTFLEASGQKQLVSLRFMMGGVDVESFGKWLLDFDPDRNVTTVEIIDGVTHLSTAYTWDNGTKWALAPLIDDAAAKNIVQDHDRNYFQLFTIAGMPDSIAFNCPRMLENELAEGRESILRLANFCKIYLPGFENAYISNIADMLGVRVSRRIKGKYVYTVDDLKSGKKFDNPVLISDYPVDVHSSERNSSKLEQTGEYQLPMESLMSADIDNLFVAGRCVSADFFAQGALRVQPNCFAMGEGIAKYIAKLIKTPL